jgi:hypothetical protein
VAVRGLSRALHSNFGFEPQKSIVVTADLHMAGYTGDRLPPMQKRLLDAVAAIPGVESVGSTDALLLNDTNASDVFTDGTTDLRAASAATSAYVYHISPEYLHARVGHSGRARGTGKGSRVGCPWAGVQIAGFRLRYRIASRNSREPGAGSHRVSGNTARSHSAGWCRFSDGAAGTGGYVDSSATRVVG